VIRGLLIRSQLGGNKVFTRRGHDVSRIEGFSDAAFGFALTLLIASQQVPQTYHDLLEAMRGFYAFAFCFAILITFWYRHYLFFRHYGLDDSYTAILNSVLLFVVLFFVFPLKFIITAVFDYLMHHPHVVKLPDGGIAPTMRLEDLPTAFQFYLFGLATVCLIFTLLYRHAYNKRFELNLSPLEVCETQITMAHHVFPMMMCLISSVFLFTIGHQTPRGAILFVIIVVGSIVVYHAMIRRWRLAVHSVVYNVEN
jgi:uncharacterized membrane protein